LSTDGRTQRDGSNGISHFDPPPGPLSAAG
jgi:hypothetical protein